MTGGGQAVLKNFETVNGSNINVRNEITMPQRGTCVGARIGIRHPNSKVGIDYIISMVEDLTGTENS